MVGKFLHDSTGASQAAFIPALMDRDVTYNEDGVGGMHVYSPWWGDHSKLNFPRGYHIEVWGGMQRPSYGFGVERRRFQPVLRTADRQLRRRPPQGRQEVLRRRGRFGGRGEGIAREDNLCEIDPNKVDEYGIPVLRFNYKWSDYEIQQAKHMRESFTEITENMGGHVLGSPATAENDYGLEAPGKIIHEVGTTRMGDNKRRSVTTPYQALHDAPNVYVMDGGPIVQQGDKNCTWTILALSMRASEHLVDSLKRMDI